MIIRIEDIKEVATKVLSAVDSNDLSKVTETLELYTKDKNLYLNVTNREYYAQVKLALGEDIDFHATVNANLFLKLIAQITTDTVELATTESTLIVKGNGTYKLPLIFDGDSLLKLPEIAINNATSNFKISSDILMSILNYNSKEILKGNFVRPVQKYYYVDECGAITFTTGACINNFALASPIKMLLPDRIVKLFKLFKGGDVDFTIGYDAITDEIIQTKVKFASDDVVLTAILSCDDSMIAQVPATAIRSRATNVYPYTVTVNKNELLQTINRLLLFIKEGNGSTKPFSKFVFAKDTVTIFDSQNDNRESIYYKNELDSCDYTATIDITDIKSTLESCTEQYLNISFGDGLAVVVSRGNVYNVIPEVKEVNA